MSIEKAPFRRYTEGEKPKNDSFTIWLNVDERRELEGIKAILQQPKDSTAIKQIAHYGYLNLLGRNSTAYLLRVVSRNSYNNKKTGVVVNSPSPAESGGNSPDNLTE
jgi:hypothetical protein